MPVTRAELVVAGAGIVGLCTALRLRELGREVLLVDRDAAGSGASSGNAGVLATHECVPLGTPTVLRSLPRLLFDADSPLSISVSALPQLSPWLLRFARESVARRARRHSAMLASLLKNSLHAYEPLIELAGAQHLLRREGALHVFHGERDLDRTAWERALRDEMGTRQVLLDRRDLQMLEPSLPSEYTRGVFFPEAAHLTDPLELMRCLERAFLRKGGEVLRAEIAGVRLSGDSVSLISNHSEICGRTTVVAMGAWSALITRQIGDRIPLETERGYHLDFPTSEPLLTRPVCPVELGLYLTPMTGRLRAAGTVELSGIHRPATPRRLELLEKSARSLFPDLPAPRAHWLGFRPSLPDSLPVVGRSPRVRSVIYAFGHGHLGVTLAAETARIVSDLIVERGDATEPAALSVTRFSWCRTDARLQ